MSKQRAKQGLGGIDRGGADTGVDDFGEPQNEPALKFAKVREYAYTNRTDVRGLKYFLSATKVSVNLKLFSGRNRIVSFRSGRQRSLRVARMLCSTTSFTLGFASPSARLTQA
jgi:hypothetical protein